METYSHTKNRLLRLYQILGDKSRGMDPIIPVSKSTWWAGVADGRFPKPIKIGRVSLWKASDIYRLMEK
jgi:predicted DNA-binding transcriptional regulator AlpA